MRGRWFFFYGTLTQDHDNAMTRVLLPLLEGGRRAFVCGQLRAVRAPQGWYPVLCAGRGQVAGRVYRLPQRVARLLDAYEEFDPRRRSRSEYVRRSLRVRIAGKGQVRAHAYRYNRPLHTGLRIIPSGDFAAYVTRHRLKAFGS
ncbi:gamma-glutamylcyclotransferase (GGCT)/AIG2-like uncharacterized protein YtfP [Novosphingobium hassiacum]|uniref:Gamma-glutamylcyclotransferase (GGCT)/AIG2-like uncharacterized protein YtfP n=1 Tax=Novosphingobium hassiacum TaxID=173676 RepID=A0A7W6EWP8_9SPHN|nr:gamma-glutamylcyclotransferase family protein [Novosphingobium hassiacum]MBB3861498.1 gamma-glutamylcyclotransferase (GGCT)/AIG2-like uncharacterized protein YtfP [Novosphingobium hassiacum]